MYIHNTILSSNTGHTNKDKLAIRITGFTFFISFKKYLKYFNS